jgi:superoxide reductase
MAEKLEVYKCAACGNVVEVLTGGVGELVCCGRPMEHRTAQRADQGKEKHVPVVEKANGGIRVRIGSVPHPMEDGHHIEWIEIVTNGKAYRQFLTPGDAPEAAFDISADKLTVREHCNLHGMWEA